MAEYYPLISRAVSGLRTATPAARQAIYDRAKQALIGQLRAMEPAVPEDAIEREITALDDAIARVESDLGAAAGALPGALPAAAVPPVALDPPLQRPAPPPPIASPRMPVAPRPSAPRIEVPAGSGAPRPPRRELPPLTPRPPLPSLRPSATRPAAPTAGGETSETEPRLPVTKPEPVMRPAAPDRPALSERSGLPSTGRDTSPPLPAAATLRIEPGTPPGLPDAAALSSGSDGSTVPALPDPPADRGRDDASRPAAPRPAVEQRTNLRVWIVAIAALAAVVVIAFTAWRLRDNPEELARVPAAATAVEPAAGKIAERADGTMPDPGSSDAPTAAAGTAATGAIATSQVQPDKAADPVPAAGTPAPADAGAAPAGTAAVPISYKAAILVDAPDEPQKVKTYVGTVVWRTETISQGQDQPIGQAIRADIDIPDAKVQIVMRFQRNTEAQFPASHTIDLKFTVAADSPLGGIKQINVPQLRGDAMPTGDPLSGVPVTITDNNFLVGLTRGAETSNFELIRTRGWFDIPMLLTTGKASKLTFEKGAAGDQVFKDVMQGWSTSSSN